MPYIKSTGKTHKQAHHIAKVYPDEFAVIIAKRIFENMLKERSISYRRR